MSLLALNAGSSSLKFGLFDDEARERFVTGEIDWAGGDRQQAELVVRPHNGTTVRSRLSVPDSAAAAACAIHAALGPIQTGGNGIPPITAVGHRVVHGGAGFRASVLIGERVKTAIARLCDVAPLHNPPALKTIEAAEAALPGVPQVAVFDTAFYAHLAPKAYLYGVPYSWYQNWGIRRFGFHGISHAYCVSRAAELLKREPAQLHLVTCHLGGGCSATAVRGGIAVATTGGFTPLDGLLMGTRCGSVDPGILTYLQRHEGLTHKDLDRALNYSAGLLGISGVSADLGEIEAAANRGNERARLAFDMLADQVRSAIAALAASLGGVDALAFTDRIGEGYATLRAAVCQDLQFMGINLDLEKNVRARPDADIATADSPARVIVVHAEEELAIAREALRVSRNASRTNLL